MGPLQNLQAAIIKCYVGTNAPIYIKSHHNNKNVSQPFYQRARADICQYKADKNIYFNI